MNDITPNELQRRLKSGEKIHILDVREDWEFEEENIGAKQIPLHELPFRLEEILDWQKTELIVHCKSGSRSRQAQKYLSSQGFKKVRSLLGGLETFRKFETSHS